jgi:L-seryl-tRNA(Ser) seleniumtransferase
MSNYADLGVKHVINAWGPMTIIGSARVRPEVVAAMAQAAAAYVDLIELQRAAGRRLAQLVGVEACYIAGGCAAGLAIATAACMTGGEPARVAQLPDTSGMKGEVIMQRSHRNPYDHAYTQVGARIIEIGHAWQTFDWELEAAIGPQTAAVIYVYTQRTRYLPLSLPETVAIAHAHEVPVIVDAAAEVPPVKNLRGLKDTGADVVVISGGKGLRGPQNSALVLTSPTLVEACIPHAAPLHSHGRSMKTTKEDIMGLVKAVELFVALDHAAVAHGWEQEVQQVIDQLDGMAGVCVVRDLARYSEGIPVARIEVDATICGHNAADIAQELAAGDPAIRVAQHGDWLSINPQFMEAGDVELVISGLRQVLNG